MEGVGGAILAPPTPHDPPVALTSLERNVWVFLLTSLLLGLVGQTLFPLRVDTPAPVHSAKTDTLRVNPSSATFEELLILPGVGPALAKRILADRERHGPYQSAEDLLRVHGIGPKTLERMRPFLVFSSNSRSP
jgi:competence ComEA-like helix-hairpin-helix protein